jgi:NADH-quinone oxidoreductase subunit M
VTPGAPMSLSVLLMVLAAFAVGACIPSGKNFKQRLGFGLIGALMTWLVVVMWPTTPSAAAPVADAGTAGEWPYLLTFLIFTPIVAAFAVLFLPRQNVTAMRYFTYAAMGVTFVASLWLLQSDMAAGWHYQHIKEWIPELGIRYHVALDGISYWLVLLTTFITPVAAFQSFGSIKSRVKELCFAFLILEGAMLGAFVSLDLFLFYVFWELMLVPMYLMIGIWGGPEKVKAAIKFFLFTMAGSVLMLAAIVYLVWTHQKITGHYSFDYLALIRVVLPKNAQFWCFWAFSIAFFIKVPMWPVHTWLPDAHVQAPTGGSVILAAVMLKLGTYAYLRFSLALFPVQATQYAANLAGIAILGGIVYAALVAWKQDDVKKLIAYSSVAHLGYIMLGLFGATEAGVKGAILQMINHGISTGALFMLVGVVYDRRHTRMIKDYGGIAKVMPVYATLFLIATFASVGVPGTNGFVGEFMIIMGTYSSKALRTFSGVHAVGAAFGVILAAVYMLSVVQKVFFGPLTAANKFLKDISPRETLAVAPLVVLIFLIGFFPNVFLVKMEQSVAMVLRHQEEVYMQIGKLDEKTDKRPAAMLPASLFLPAMMKGAPSWDAEEAPALVADAGKPAVAPPPPPPPTPAPPAVRQPAGPAALTQVAPGRPPLRPMPPGAQPPPGAPAPPPPAPPAGGPR